MKVIDLLNKIANGEEVPKKIKYINSIWKYDKETKDYFHDDLGLIYSMTSIGLTEGEVEIIEEPQEHKIPEKIDQWDRQWHYTYYKKEQLNQMQDNIEQLRQKYNKIVDYLEEIE